MTTRKGSGGRPSSAPRSALRACPCSYPVATDDPPADHRQPTAQVTQPVDGGGILRQLGKIGEAETGNRRQQVELHGRSLVALDDDPRRLAIRALQNFDSGAGRDRSGCGGGGDGGDGSKVMARALRRIRVGALIQQPSRCGGAPREQAADQHHEQTVGDEAETAEQLHPPACNSGGRLHRKTHPTESPSSATGCRAGATARRRRCPRPFLRARRRNAAGPSGRSDARRSGG